MRTRRGWVGLAGVLGVLLAACEEPGPGDGAGTGVAGAAEAEEDTLTAVATLTCPAVSAVRAREDTIALAPGESRVVRLEGAGRNHSLWIWGDSAGTRNIVLSEMVGEQNGVDIDVSPEPESPSQPWAMLTLDARDCPRGLPPFIVKRHDDGVFTRPDGGYDSTSVSAFAVLRGNSGYMLATPTKRPPDEP